MFCVACVVALLPRDSFAGPSTVLVPRPDPSVIPAQETEGPDDAVLRLRSTLRARPGDLEALLQLSKVLALSGRREEGLTLLEVELSKERSQPRRVQLARRLEVLAHLFLSNVQQQTYFEGVTLLLARRYPEALGRFEKVNAAESQQADVLFRLGQVQLLLGDAETAVEYFSQSVRFARATPVRKLWQARALDLKGDVLQAREAFAKTAVAVGSSLRALWYADLFMRMGKVSAARELLVNALKREPGEVRLWRARAELEIEAFDVAGRSTARQRRELKTLALRLETVLRDGPRGRREREDEPATVFFLETDEEARSQAIATLETLRSRLSPLERTSGENAGP